MASRIRRRADHLRNWLRDNVTHRADVKDIDGPEPDMPYLSYPPITLLGSLSHGDGASLSPFFARLPFDIRRHILIDAFGDHTVHMHLRLEHIPRRRPRREPRSPNIPTIFNTTRPHGGVTADLDHTGLWSNVVLVESDVARGGPHGRRWQWWGCVCHRSMPTRRIGGVHGVWEDKCLVGEAEYCDMYGSTHPDRCMIGCMGWLLASRHAYAEGIDVLYGSNTICIMSDRLLNALLRSTPITLLGISPVPQSTLLPPSHLAHITRLELAWEWTLLEDPALAPHQAAQRAVFEDALALLPSAFPNLVSLYVSFSKKLYQRTSIRADACLDEIHQVLLAPLEAMMDRLSRLQRHLCFVELPVNTSLPLIERVGCYVDPAVVLLALQPPYNERRCWLNRRGQGVDNIEGTKYKEVTQGKQQTGFWIKMGTLSPVVHDEMVQLRRLGAPNSPNTSRVRATSYPLFNRIYIGNDMGIPDVIAVKGPVNTQYSARSAAARASFSAAEWLATWEMSRISGI